MNIGPNDIHMVVSHSTKTLKEFDGHGNLIRTSTALTSGTGGGVDSPGGDTPLGDWKVTGVIPTTSADTAETWASYGPFFLELWDMEAQERNRGRAGIGAHGGRGNLAEDDHQELRPTHGCIRLENDDLIHWIAPKARYLLAGGSWMYFSVVA